MKVAVAIDSFKGSLSTFEAGKAVLEGIKNVYNDADVKICPMADGGEGTSDAIVCAAGGSFNEVTVHNPVGTLINARYGVIEKSKTAVIEMAAAAGLTLIKENERNPLYTTTCGVGEMILDAINKGYRSFIIGIGGSATNDGGAGMLQALGFEFLDEFKNQIPYGAIGLKSLKEIKSDKVNPKLSECSFLVACDVKNELCGSNGCSKVFAPQKGASDDMICDMDKWLENYAKLTKKVNPNSNPNYPGAGAAGGLGFAFLSYLNAHLKSGVDIVIDEIKLEDYISTCDIVITGEGRLDGQSYMGKAPIGVAKLAKKHNKPVIAFSGCVTDDAKNCNKHGIDAFFPILQSVCSLEDAMKYDNAFSNLKNTAEQVFRLIKTIKRN